MASTSTRTRTGTSTDTGTDTDTHTHTDTGTTHILRLTAGGFCHVNINHHHIIQSTHIVPDMGLNGSMHGIVLGCVNGDMNGNMNRNRSPLIRNKIVIRNVNGHQGYRC